MSLKSRILILAVLVSIAFVGFIVSALLWQRQSPNVASDPYATLPFRPAVTYDSGNVSIRNTEQEPYLNTSLRLYVGGTLYSMQVGTIRPGETVTHSLLSLTNEHSDKFNPNSVGSTQISELEVRATFRGQEVHKDFPPPKRILTHPLPQVVLTCFLLSAFCLLPSAFCSLLTAHCSQITLR